ncbi:hypothetical protein KQX54_003251 [Cotesia glomerata]|uniref:Uncharacterized protein n=1 Tax=Cotesia glomerata TaxID=32391 RepID=A0AAV7HYC4_COTGL|nr:hypothetical protein KQX54_003251 [Cotesia glomerata]
MIEVNQGCNIEALQRGIDRQLIQQYRSIDHMLAYASKENVNGVQKYYAICPLKRSNSRTNRNENRNAHREPNSPEVYRYTIESYVLLSTPENTQSLDSLVKPVRTKFQFQSRYWNQNQQNARSKRSTILDDVLSSIVESLSKSNLGEFPDLYNFQSIEQTRWALPISSFSSSSASHHCVLFFFFSF